jgi:4-amino-4-deoxy-L-arabinose transferase-like glycosyltransferase
MSGSLMAHPAELFWTALFMLAWTKALRRGRARWALVAGAAIGILFLTRQITAVVVGLSFGGGLLAVALWRRRFPPDTAIPRPSRSLVRLPAALLVAAAPFALALFAHQAALTGDPLTDPRLLYWPYDRLGFGPEIGEPENVYTYWQSESGPAIQWTTDPDQPPRGHTPSRGLYNLGRNVTALEQYLFGWPALFTLAFIWLAFLLRRPSAADKLLLLVIAAIAAGYVAFWASGIAYGPRYLYAALPALLILTARGIGALAVTAGRRPTAVLVVLLLFYNLINLPGRIEGYRGYNFVSGENRAAIEAVVAPPALVFVAVSEADWWEYGAFFTANTPFLDGAFVYARDLGDAENDRLRAAFPGRAAYLWRDGELTALGP